MVCGYIIFALGSLSEAYTFKYILFVPIQYLNVLVALDRCIYA